MKKEDQVCSYEQSKRLVELGVVLSTEKYWVGSAKDCSDMIDHYILETKIPRGPIKYINKVEFTQDRIDHMLECFPHQIYPAPNVAELGVLLQGNITGEDKAILIEFNNYRNDLWEIEIIDLCDNENLLKFIAAKTEAQARAEALIWLIENGYVKVEDLKL